MNSKQIEILLQIKKLEYAKLEAEKGSNNKDIKKDNNIVKKEKTEEKTEVKTEVKENKPTDIDILITKNIAVTDKEVNEKIKKLISW